MDFKPVEKSDKALIDEYIARESHENSHFNFTNFFVWRKPFHIHYAVWEDILFIKSMWQGERRMLQPFCDEENKTKAINAQIEWFRKNNYPVVIADVEKKAAEFYEEFSLGKLKKEARRNEYDYLYRSEDLITLAGRKLHAKKNHLNRFNRDNPGAEYFALDEKNAPECIELVNSWAKHHLELTPDDEYIAPEAESIGEILNDFAYFKLKGGAIRLGGKIAALALGERLNENTAVIHIEKADPNINGAYAAINREFAADAWSDMEFINREEDMGIEGLRKAKESYKPVRMIEKFFIGEA